MEIECTIENVQIQKSIKEVYCNRLGEQSFTTTSEATQPVSDKSFCHMLENDSSTRLPTSNVGIQVVKPQHVTLSEKTKIRITGPPLKSPLVSKPAKSLIKITKVLSPVDKASGLIQSSDSNRLIQIQPRLSNMFDSGNPETDNKTQRAIRKHSCSDELYIQPKKSMKTTSGLTQNLLNSCQEKLIKNGVECTSRVGMDHSDCLDTGNRNTDALFSESENNTLENIRSESDEDVESNCKTARR